MGTDPRREPVVSARDAGTSTPATPAADLAEHARQLAADLADAVACIPPVGIEDGEHVARQLSRIAEDCAEAAAMVRALPGRPAERPGYTSAGLAAVITAAEAEHDFGAWLADLLCRAAAFLGSADHLVMGRSGSWEARHVTGLVTGTAGSLPGDLDRFKDGAQ
jgi:hypothetical protein